MAKVDIWIGTFVYRFNYRGIRNDKAFLLNNGGSKLCDFYYTLETEEDREYQQVKARLDTYFHPKINIIHNFKQLVQDEPVDKFVTRLLVDASFTTLHERLVQKSTSDKLRRKE